MAEGNGSGAANEKAPQLNVLVQFTRDFSFENPRAPGSLAEQDESPNISIQVNVNAEKLSDTDFEVSLHIEGTAGEGAKTLFKFELEYGGVFSLQNIPEEELQPIVLIECPRLLFPFARQIIADGVRNGGYPPLYIDPIDFVALYQQQLEQLATAPGAAN
mgnify:FL=1|jgi:preprotein translocase subunit SecB